MKGALRAGDLEMVSRFSEMVQRDSARLVVDSEAISAYYEGPRLGTQVEHFP